MRNVSVKGLRGPPSSSASPYSSCEAAFAGLRVILFSNGGSYLIGVRRGISNIQMKHRQIYLHWMDTAMAMYCRVKPAIPLLGGAFYHGIC